jgi:hypothetical protein
MKRQERRGKQQLNSNNREIGEGMVTACANPTCGKPLHYLREGRIFLFEVPNNRDDEKSRRLEHFWLCGECNVSFYIEQDGDAGVKLVPKMQPRRPTPVLSPDEAIAS